MCVRALEAAVAAPAQLILDPGLGFAKLPDHNWKLLASLGTIGQQPGYPSPFPVLIAASRKGFLGRLLAGPHGQPRPFAGSDDATVAGTALAGAAGRWCVPGAVVAGKLAAGGGATRGGTQRPT